MAHVALAAQAGAIATTVVVGGTIYLVVKGAQLTYSLIHDSLHYTASLSSTSSGFPFLAATALLRCVKPSDAPTNTRQLQTFYDGTTAWIPPASTKWSTVYLRWRPKTKAGAECVKDVKLKIRWECDPADAFSIAAVYIRSWVFTDSKSRRALESGLDTNFADTVGRSTLASLHRAFQRAAGVRPDSPVFDSDAEESKTD